MGSTQMESVVWQHPEKGFLRLWYTWRREDPDWVPGQIFSWVPVAVEFDLFSTPEEQRELLRELRTNEDLGAKIRERHHRWRS